MAKPKKKGGEIKPTPSSGHGDRAKSKKQAIVIKPKPKSSGSQGGPPRQRSGEGDDKARSD